MVISFRENLEFGIVEWSDRIREMDGSFDSVIRLKTGEEQFASHGPIKFVHQLIGKTIFGKECIGLI